jgi:hypothetical protein
MVAGKLSNMNVGKPAVSNSLNLANSANLRNNISQTSAAELLNVSERSVKRAKKVQDKAVPESWRICLIIDREIRMQICTLSKKVQEKAVPESWRI